MQSRGLAVPSRARPPFPLAPFLLLLLALGLIAAGWQGQRQGTAGGGGKRGRTEGRASTIQGQPFGSSEGGNTSRLPDPPSAPSSSSQDGHPGPTTAGSSSSSSSSDTRLVIHLVLTSHMDPGWLDTYQGYAQGAGGSIIQGAVLASLCAGHAAPYTLSDMSFLLHWVGERGREKVGSSVQEVVDRCKVYEGVGEGNPVAGLPSRLAAAAAIAIDLTPLHPHDPSSHPALSHGTVPTWWQALLWAVQEHVIELTSGSWVQHDEALTPVYLSNASVHGKAGTAEGQGQGQGEAHVQGPAVEQVKLGRTLLARALAPLLSNTNHTATSLLSAFPSLRVAYQSDVFGHSPSTPPLLSALGYAYGVMNRVPYRDKMGRRGVTEYYGESVLRPAGAAQGPHQGVRELAARLPPSVVRGGVRALHAHMARHCAMQGYGPVLQESTDVPTFLHILHEHYNHPLSHPTLKGLSCMGHGVGLDEGIDGEGEGEAQLQAWAKALLEAGQAIASSYCSGYPTPSPSNPGHALVLIGDDFSHASLPAMACMHKRVGRVVREGNRVGGGIGVEVRVSTLHDYLHAAKGQYDAWAAALESALHLAQSGTVAPLSTTAQGGLYTVLGMDGQEWQGAEVQGMSSADMHPFPPTHAPSLPILPGLDTFFPYQDRPWANAWSGFYGTAGELKLAISKGIQLHVMSLQVADRLLAESATTTPPSPALPAPFIDMCTSSGGSTPDAQPLWLHGITGRIKGCMASLEGAACQPSHGSPPPPPTPGPILYSPTDARSARLYLTLHHDGITGTSRSGVLRDYWDGVGVAAEQALVCLQWAAKLSLQRSPSHLVPDPSLIPLIPLIPLVLPRASADSVGAGVGVGVGVDEWDQHVHLDMHGAASPVALLFTPSSTPLSFTITIDCTKDGDGDGEGVMKALHESVCGDGQGKGNGQGEEVKLQVEATILGSILPTAHVSSPRRFLIPVVTLSSRSSTAGSTTTVSLTLKGRMVGVEEVEEEGGWEGGGVGLVSFQVMNGPPPSASDPFLPLPPIHMDSSTGRVHVGGWAIGIHTTSVARQVGLGSGAYVLRMPGLVLAAIGGAFMAGAASAALVAVCLTCCRGGCPYPCPCPCACGRPRTSGARPGRRVGSISTTVQGAGEREGQVWCTLISKYSVLIRALHSLRLSLPSLALFYAGEGIGWMAGVGLASPWLVHDKVLQQVVEHGASRTGLTYVFLLSFLPCTSAILWLSWMPRSTTRAVRAGIGTTGHSSMCALSGLQWAGRESETSHDSNASDSEEEENESTSSTHPSHPLPLPLLTSINHTLSLPVGCVFGMVLLLVAWPDAFLRPMVHVQSMVQSDSVSVSPGIHSRQAVVHLTRGVAGDDDDDDDEGEGEAACRVDITLTHTAGHGNAARGGASTSLTVTPSCVHMEQVELWMSITREDTNTVPVSIPSMPLSPTLWPPLYGSPYAVYGDNGWDSMAGTVVSMGMEALGRFMRGLSTGMSLSHLPRLCVHDGVQYVGRPAALPGQELPFHVYPLTGTAVPCKLAPHADPTDPTDLTMPTSQPMPMLPSSDWHLSMDRPAGVAWTEGGMEGWRWPWGRERQGGMIAYVLLNRHSHVDDEKGLGMGAEAWLGDISGTPHTPNKGYGTLYGGLGTVHVRRGE